MSTRAAISEPGKAGLFSGVRAVVFDLDDTLASEYEYVRSGYRAVAEELRRRFPECSLAADRLWALFEESPKQVFNRFLEENGIAADEETIKALVGVYRAHVPDIHYYPDVLPLLSFLKEKDFRTGILSDGYEITQRRKVEALHAERDFDRIVLTDALGGREMWKPSLAGFEVIAGELGVALSEILYVGDNPAKDFYCRRAGAVRTARILRDAAVYRDAPYYRDVKEECRLTSLSELPALL